MLTLYLCIYLDADYRYNICIETSKVFFHSCYVDVPPPRKLGVIYLHCMFQIGDR